jgi:hypothetical protein
MASGYLTKQADQLTGSYLNAVNDAAAGGQIVSLPAGVTGPAYSATQAGDRIVGDDITMLALSNTTTGTLYGGIYEYVATTASPTRAIVRGGIAFWVAADIGVSYTISSDAQPATTSPAFFAGIFINAITAGNWGWIQTAGVASVLFDSTITATTVGQQVTAKVSAVVASTADNGAAATQETQAAAIGVSAVTVAASTISTVFITRSPFGRI